MKNLLIIIAALIGFSTAQAGEFTLPGLRSHQRTPVENVTDGYDHALGEIVPTFRTSCPSRSIEADGSAVSRTKYGKLFSAMGTIYGTGDGSTTFNIPNYRGEFLRGWDHAAGNDPDAASRTTRGDGTTGDAVGTKQADQFLAHTHSVSAATSSSGTWTLTGGKQNISSNTFTSNSPCNSCGNETRPLNINVLFCIFTGA